MCVGFLVLVAFGKARAGDQLNYPVYLLKQGPVMDGRIEGDIAWTGIPQGVGFHVIGGRSPLDKQTTFRMGFTADNLYVSFVCIEPDMASLADIAKDNNPAIWKEDGVEFFILPRDTGNVFQVIVNAAGAHTNYQTNISDPRMAGIALLSGSRAAAFKGKGFYSVEIEIPFKVLGCAPNDREVWTGNFGRNINLGSGLQHYSLAHTVQGYCDPDRFAQLVFHRKRPTDTVKVVDALAYDDAELHLIVNLSFDKGYGDIAHGQSAIINDGKITGAKWVEGRFGKALQFEKGNYVKVPHSESIKSITDAITLECWAYFDLDKLSGTRGVLISTTPSSGFWAGFSLGYNDAGRSSRAIGLSLAQSGKVRGGGSAHNAIKTSGWHHIIGTYDANLTDGKSGKIYVDGRLVKSFETKIKSITSSKLPLMIGSQPVSRQKMSEMTGTFLGRIDEVKVWSKALSAEDIEKLYSSIWAKSKLVSPGPSEVVKDGRPRFCWTPAEDGTGYVFELANVPDFSAGVVKKETLLKPEFTIKKPLSPGVYYWRVWSTDKKGKPTAACKPRAVVVPWQARFKTADTTPPKITDVKPVLDTCAESAAPVISARWSDDQGIDVKSARLLLDGRDIIARAKITAKGISFIPESVLSKGVHTIEVSVKDTSGNSANRVRQHFSVGEPYTTVVKVGQDLNTYINDEPFFPIMSYSGGVSREQRARTGFNSCYGGAGLAEEVRNATGKRKPSLLVKTGIKSFGTFGTLMKRKSGYDGFAKSVPFYDKHVDFLAYALHEPDKYPKGIKYATKMWEIVLANGHRRPVIHRLTSPGAAAAFSKVGDGVMQECWPLPNRPLAQVAKYIDHAYKMMDYKKPVWFCQQAYSWELYGRHYYKRLPEGKTKQDVLISLKDSGFVFRPTPAEMRAMTYLALAHNARGILWHSYSVSSKRLSSIVDFPEEYAALEKLAGEIRYLSAMLVAPETSVQVKVEPEGLGLHMKTKSFDGRIYIIAVNPNEHLPIAPVFKLPAGAHRKVDVLFENRTQKLKGNTFQDFFEPAGVHIYRIE